MHQPRLFVGNIGVEPQEDSKIHSASLTPPAQNVLVEGHLSCSLTALPTDFIPKNVRLRIVMISIIEQVAR